MSQGLLEKIDLFVRAERDEILTEVNEELREKLEPIPVHINMGDETTGLYGDYSGTPSGSESAFGATGPSSDITIYAIGFSGMEHDEPALRKKVKKVLMHEYGHYLGFGEGYMRENGIC
ncbi:MAG: metallopeptidase family protein [Candidatus Gracilibacteria bacterium]|nr:metallopeptidase family protein [Candidatus Gracilibacteria bacterium]